MKKQRYIVHIDMDAFFAAVEQRDDPSLRGTPVVIGADPKGGRGRGVVSTCSYEAREFGIHSAMPISQAYYRCPHATFLLPDMEKYVYLSRCIMRILYDFSPQIEPVSIDEAFIDITGSAHLFGTPQETCKKIKACIQNELGLTASVGCAPIKMAAKIASDMKKPDGLVMVGETGLRDFLWPLTIDHLWGVGKKTAKVLHECGMYLIGDIAQKQVRELEALLGAQGVHLRQLANGIDERDVELEEPVQSVSNEYTFDVDTADNVIMEGTLLRLCEKVSGRLRADDLQGRTITLRIRFKDFATYTRSVTISHVTNYVDIMYTHIRELFRTVREDYSDKKYVRLLGVKMSKLGEASEIADLFSDTVDLKRERIHKAIDTITNTFGDDAIWRARRE